MISSMFTMRAILVMTLFIFILLIPATSGVNQTHTSPTTSLPNNMTASTEAQDNKRSSSDRTTMTTEKNVTPQNEITPASPSPPSSSAVSLRSTATTQLDQISTTNTTHSSKPVNSKLLLLVILLAILVLVLFIGCLHAMWDQHSGQDRSVPRLLLGVRERLRAVIRNLEDRIGLCLWPGWKRGEGEDEETEGRQEEEAQRTEDGGEGGSRGVVVGSKEIGEHNEEDSDSSDDYSSMEGENLRERALTRQEEEERQQNANEDGEETSSASEEGQNAVVGVSSGDKEGSSEEIALVCSLKEDVKKGDLCDVTVL